VRSCDCAPTSWFFAPSARLSRTQEYPAYGSLYRTVAGSVRRFLALEADRGHYMLRTNHGIPMIRIASQTRDKVSNSVSRFMVKHGTSGGSHVDLAQGSMTQKLPLVSHFPTARWVAANPKNASSPVHTVTRPREYRDTPPAGVSEDWAGLGTSTSVEPPPYASISFLTAISEITTGSPAPVAPR